MTPSPLDNLSVPKEKILGYLLSDSHPAGRSKADWFKRYGFSAQNWQTLAQALVRHATVNAIAEVADSPFGKRYTIEGRIESPDGQNLTIRSAWFVETGSVVARFVTAYPARRKNA